MHVSSSTPSPRPKKCRSCSTELPAGKKFCPQCGAAADGKGSREVRRTRQAVQAIAIIFCGVVVSLLASAAWSSEYVENDWEVVLSQGLMSLSFLSFGVLAVWRLGPGALAASFASRCSLAQLGLGVLVGLFGVLISITYVSGVDWMLGTNTEALSDEYILGLPALLITSVLYPALAEEWLNRGVLWVALERIAKPATVILCTAFAFAVMHGLNGGRYLELPHRFAGGLLLGWLRHRTGSLAPPIAGHATLNLIACLME